MYMYVSWSEEWFRKWFLRFTTMQSPILLHGLRN